MRGEARSLAEAAKKFTTYGDQQVCLSFASKFGEAASRLRKCSRDLIDGCLSETQKLHVGALSVAAVAAHPIFAPKDPKDPADLWDVSGSNSEY